MAREDWEARERLTTDAADEEYMAELRQQHSELAEVKWSIFAEHGGKVIVISDDEVQGSEKEHEFDVEEWRRIFPGCDINGTDLDPCLTGGGVSRQDWLDPHHGNDDDDDESSVI
ncbi:Zinc finger protein CONSTANS-LIKE 13 [Hordeum vulgare]|nr:Zinc finger protein CONSTANS-LIKE 13 [Hordeum vulgare]